MVPRAFNPYATPISNPRQVNHTHTAAASSLLDASPIPAINSHNEIALNEEGSTDEGIGEMLQATATTQGRLSFYYDKFVAACQRVSILLFM